MRPVHMLMCLLCAAGCLLFGTVEAQTGQGVYQSDDLDDLMGMELEDLLKISVFSAARHQQKLTDSPRSVSVITREEIRRRNYRTTPEALNELVGVLVQETNYGGGSPFIRGLVGNQILILIDGIRLNNAIFRLGPNQYLNTVDINQIERIEVVRGTGSVLYGSDALGGVINIVTKSEKAGEGRIDLQGRSFVRYASADQGTIGRVEFRGSGRPWGLIGGLSYKKFGDLRAGRGIGLQTYTGYDESDADFKLNLRLKEGHQVTAALQHVRQTDVPRTDRLASGVNLKYEWNPQARDLAYAQYEASDLGSLVNTVRLALSYQTQSGTVQTILTATPDVQDEYFDRVNTLGASFQLSSTLGKRQLLTYGVEYYGDRIASSKVNVDFATGTETQAEGTFADGSTYRSMGAFLQDEIQVYRPLSLVLGARYSRFRVRANLDDPNTGSLEIRSTPHAVTGSAYALCRLTDKVTATLGVAQGFRAPDIDDLTILGSFSSGFEVPNPDLTPEQSINYEFGLRVQHSRYSGSVYYFFTDIQDMIVRGAGEFNGLPFMDYNGNGIQDPGEEDVYQRRNLGRARIQGSEAEGRLRILPFLTAIANLAWIRGDDLAADTPLRRMPPLRGKLGLDWSTTKGMWIEVYSLFAAKQDRLAPGDVSDPRIPDGGTPGYLTLNLRGGIDIRPYGNFTLGCENVTNQAYRLHGSGIDGPGINLVIGYELPVEWL